MAEAYKLYHQLKEAPPDRQEVYLAAFAAGTSSVSGQARPEADPQSAPAAARGRRSHSPPHSTGTAWRRSALAMQFYRFGVRCAQGDTYLDGQVPALGRRYLTYVKQLPPDAPEAERYPLGGTPEKTLRTLSLFFGAHCDLPEVRQARLRYPTMAEADRLFHLLQHAPAQRQQQCAEAFQAGLTRGEYEFRRAQNQRMEKERAAEKRRLAAHRRLTKELLAGTPDAQLEEVIIDYVTNKLDDHWDRYDAIVPRVPKPIQMVSAMLRVDGLIGDDGLEEFDEWELVPLAAAGYRLVGAPRHAELIERAAAFVPKQKQKEEAIAEAGGEPDENNRTVEALDDEFDALDRSEAVDPLVIRYIRAHLDQFVTD